MSKHPALIHKTPQMAWDFLGFVLILIGVVAFFLPVALGPQMDSGQALGLTLIASPLCMVAAIVCIFIGRE